MIQQFASNSASQSSSRRMWLHIVAPDPLYNPLQFHGHTIFQIWCKGRLRSSKTVGLSHIRWSHGGVKKIVRKVGENPITFPLDQHPKKSGETNKHGNGGDNHEASSFAYFCYRSFMLDQSRSAGNACTYHIRGRGGVTTRSRVVQKSIHSMVLPSIRVG